MKKIIENEDLTFLRNFSKSHVIELNINFFIEIFKKFKNFGLGYNIQFFLENQSDLCKVAFDLVYFNLVDFIVIFRNFQF